MYEETVCFLASIAHKGLLISTAFFFNLEPLKSIGLFQKISSPPWMKLNWVPKNFRISKKDNSSFCRIPNAAHSKSWGIPEFCKILNGFPGIPVKIHKIFGKFMDFQSGSLSIYYRISDVVHQMCVDIFWNSPLLP